MGRPRKPLAHHEATGAVAKNPKRFRDREPEPVSTEGIGGPPEEWKRPSSLPPGTLEAIWHRIVSVAPAGMLTAMDRELLRGLCPMIAERDRPGVSVKQRLALQKSISADLGKIGFNPVDRTRIATRKAKEVDGRSPEGWQALAEERAVAVTPKVQ